MHIYTYWDLVLWIAREGGITPLLLRMSEGRATETGGAMLQREM